MLSVTPSGIPNFYDMCSAHHHDINGLEELASIIITGLALGDKGFIDDERHHYLLEHYDIHVLTYKRTNQHAQIGDLEKWMLDTYRQRIETTGSQLVDLMHLDQLGAKSDVSWAKRLIGAMTAFTLDIYLYFCSSVKVAQNFPVFRVKMGNYATFLCYFCGIAYFLLGCDLLAVKALFA